MCKKLSLLGDSAYSNLQSTDCNFLPLLLGKSNYYCFLVSEQLHGADFSAFCVF